MRKTSVSEETQRELHENVLELIRTLRHDSRADFTGINQWGMRVILRNEQYTLEHVQRRGSTENEMMAHEIGRLFDIIDQERYHESTSTDEEDPTALRRVIERGKDDFVVARNIHGEVVGVLWTKLFSLRTYPETSMMIYRIDIKPSYRRLGLSRLLLAAALRKALKELRRKKSSLTSIIMEASTLNEEYSNHILDARRIYSFTHKGECIEVPCVSPPADDEVAPDNPLEGNWHWMVSTFSRTGSMKTRKFCFILHEIYRDYARGKKRAYQVETRRRERFVYRILQLGNDVYLTLLSRMEREHIERVLASQSIRVVETCELGSWLKQTNTKLYRTWMSFKSRTSI